MSAFIWDIQYLIGEDDLLEYNGAALVLGDVVEDGDALGAKKIWILAFWVAIVEFFRST